MRCGASSSVCRFATALAQSNIYPQGFDCFDQLFTILVMILISKHAFYYIYISRWYYMQNEFFAESSSFHLQERNEPVFL